jgi:hypothetical protein
MGTWLKSALAAWAWACPRPLVLLFDEIDALRGQSLISVLRQLRAGFNERPQAFPASVALCGQRDVRDYHSPETASRFRGSRRPPPAATRDRLGTASPFNIKVESLRLGDFTPAEVRELYAQQHPGHRFAMPWDPAPPRLARSSPLMRWNGRWS